MDAALDVEAVVHDLAEEVLGAEDVLELGGRLDAPASYWPSRSRVWISPDGQPVVAIRPLP